MDRIKVVIGSWGSYNACNERALGSSWLDLSDYSDWEEIEAELTKQGFKLNGIDEELFIQDIEGLPSSCKNWDNVHPKNLFEMLYESGVLEDAQKYKVMEAYLEILCFDDFENAVDAHGSNWDDNIIIYEGFNWEDYGREMYEICGYELPNDLECYFDFERYGESFRHSGVEEYSGGIIVMY